MRIGSFFQAVSSRYRRGRSSIGISRAFGSLGSVAGYSSSRRTSSRRTPGLSLIISWATPTSTSRQFAVSEATTLRLAAHDAEKTSSTPTIAGTPAPEKKSGSVRLIASNYRNFRADGSDDGSGGVDDRWRGVGGELAARAGRQQPDPVEQRQGHRVAGPGAAVLDLEGDPDRPLAAGGGPDRDRVDGLGALLTDRPAPLRFQEVGREPTAARDHLRSLPHRVADRAARLPLLAGLPLDRRRHEPRVGERQGGERHREDRKPAAVDGPFHPLLRDRPEAGDPAPDFGLERMVRLPVALRGVTPGAAGEEKARVLPRTVVVELRRRLSANGEDARGPGIHRLLGAAHEVPSREAAAGKEPRGDPHVPGLAPVGRAEERDLRGPEPEVLRAARDDQWERLERLRGGPGEDRPARVPAPGENLPRLVHDRRVATVARLDETPAKDPREEGGCVGHRRVVSEKTRLPPGRKRRSRSFPGRFRLPILFSRLDERPVSWTGVRHCARSTPKVRS